MNRPFVIGLILFVLIFGGFLLFLKHRQAANIRVATQTQSQANHATAPVSQRRINVKLFFNAPDNAELRSEDRSITYQETLAGETREILKELIKGPTAESLISTIPDGTQLLDVFITKDGTAYADFSHELADNHSGGSQAEINTVFSIIDTLTLNFPQIKKVQILLGDQVVETLKGHVDLSHPLEKNLSIVEGTKAPQTAPAETQTNQTTGE
jgi:germination protein M